MANIANVKKEEINFDKIKTQSEDELFYFVDCNSAVSERITAPRYSYWKSVFRIFFKRKSNWVILGLLTILILCILFIPWIHPYNEFEHILDTAHKNLTPWEAFAAFGPSIEWIFGSGNNTNSLFYGVWASAQLSLALAVICAAINMVLGIIIGALWGYSKVLDNIFNVIYNIVSNVPYILLISILVYVLDRGFGSFVFALTITGWLGIAYFFRTQVLIIRDREYNLASRCLGTPIGRVVVKNVLPYLTSVIVTLIATEIPSYISMEVFLSYIGIGFSGTTPSLGRMIEVGSTGWQNFPWTFWVPVAVSSALTIALYFTGQNLADASDPRSHMQ